MVGEQCRRPAPNSAVLVEGGVAGERHLECVGLAIWEGAGF